MGEGRVEEGDEPEEKNHGHRHADEPSINVGFEFDFVSNGKDSGCDDEDIHHRILIGELAEYLLQ